MPPSSNPEPLQYTAASIHSGAQAIRQDAAELDADAQALQGDAAALEADAAQLADLTSAESQTPLPSLLPTDDRRLTTLDLSWASLGRVTLTVASIYILVKIWPVIITIGLSAMLAATFHPVLRRLQSLIPRPWAVTTLVVGVAALSAATCVVFLPVLFGEAIKGLNQLPVYAKTIQGVLASHRIHVNVPDQLQHVSASLMANMPRYLRSLLEVLVSGITISVLTAYFLLEGDKVERSVLLLLPRSHRAATRRLAGEIGQHIGSYMRGQLLTSLMAGRAIFLLLFLNHVPQAPALAAYAALADTIPVLGSLLTVVPCALMALTVSPSAAGFVLVGFAVYHILEANVISPRIYGNLMGLSLSAVLVSFLIGGQLLGIVGALVALPIAAGIPSVLRYLHECQGLDEEEETPAG